LGAIQEWLRFLGRTIGFKKDIEISEKIDKYLRYVKYFILAIIVYFSFYLGDLVFRMYDPFVALVHFGTELEEKIIGYLILGLIIISAIFSKSLWCRYFCPLGAFFAIFKKISFLKIKRDTDSCIDCGICDRICVANLKIKTADVIKSADCISCGKCISDCPKDSLSYMIFGRAVSKKIFLLMVIILVLVPLSIAPFTPFWQTKVQSNVVNVKGELNVADIRGSNTLNYLIETTKVPLSEFQKVLALPEKIDTSLKLKSIGLEYGLKNERGEIIETEDFRKVVEQYIAEEKVLKKVEIKKYETDCLFGKTDCKFPGDCGRYVDNDENRVCDHSE